MIAKAERLFRYPRQHSPRPPYVNDLPQAIVDLQEQLLSLVDGSESFSATEKSPEWWTGACWDDFARAQDLSHFGGGIDVVLESGIEVILEDRIEVILELEATLG